MNAQPRFAALIFAAVALAAPAGAQAATLSPASAKPCFGTGDAVPLVGSGYTPNAAVQIARDGALIGTGTADPSGNLGGFASVPALPRPEQQATYTATDQANTANVGTSPPILLSQLKVGIQPEGGNPRRRRRVRTRGWTIRGTSVFAHIRRGRFKSNIRVGKLKGPCRTSSKRVRLFSREAEPGVYRVQFDTFKGFKSKRAQRVAFRITIFRTFRRASASGASSASVAERWKLLDPPAAESLR
ncbi:MAG: hypothetical protein AABM31_11765 [Actinomycetota bacterium]